MACDSLLTTSLSQVFDKLVDVDYQNLLSAGLVQDVSTICNKTANDKLQQALFYRLIITIYYCKAFDPWPEIGGMR